MMPLDKIQVIDLSEEIAGPYCAMQLGDAGADVIKVEPISGDWSRKIGVQVKGESALFMALNRNKKSIAVDIEKTEGKDIVHRLVKKADILVESLGNSNLQDLELGYDQLSRVNPQLIYCAITPYGNKGPYKDLPATELEIQGILGYPWYLGQRGAPPVRVGTDVANMAAGMWAFIGIVTALYHRKKTGVGQKVETSLLQGLAGFLTQMVGSFHNPDSWGGWFITGPFDYPETGYRTKDRPIAFGMPLAPGKTQAAWETFCKEVGLGELLEDPYFREKGMRMIGIGRDAQEFKPVIETGVETKTSEEIKTIIEKVGGFYAIYKDYEQIFNEPQVQYSQMEEEIDHPVVGKLKMTGLPWKLRDTPGKISNAPPVLGQHTNEILSQLGYQTVEITALRKSKIVA